MIDAEPNSGWLFGIVKLDKKGFILTGGANGFETTPNAPTRLNTLHLQWARAPW